MPSQKIIENLLLI